MIYHANLPKSFWGEAVNTTVHILNRLPTKAVADKTPFEVFTGKRPSVSYFKVFGCSAFVHIPEQKRTKLDSKSTKMIFVGYSSKSKAYRLWDQDEKKIIISRDVIFDENLQRNEEDVTVFPSPTTDGIVIDDTPSTSSIPEPDSTSTKLPPKWLLQTLKDSKVSDPQLSSKRTTNKKYDRMC